ncbi:MAG: T9SS type A sorting domain-containing protein [Bacteroidales bacterium]|nr:T9SS type A sorting domain-containing protein [Bacteroidales bacterium]
MKRLLILNLTLLFFSICSFGQKKLLSENNVWNEAYWFNGINGFFCDFSHSLRLGEVVNKKDFSYNEILDDISGEVKIVGFIREENNKYYFLPTNFTEEYLLYDFDLQEGDVISVIETVADERDFMEKPFEERKKDLEDGKCTHTVTKVEQIADQQGNLRKNITLDNNIVWIEGIGSVRGLLHSYGSTFGSYLTSFTENEEVVFQQNICPCNKTSLSETYLDSYISPNPVKDILHITLQTANNLIQIIDAQGRKVLQTECRETASINVSHLKNGVYTVIVNNNQSQTFVKE